MFEDYLGALIAADINRSVAVIVANFVIGPIAQEGADNSSVTFTRGLMEGCVTRAPSATSTWNCTNVGIGVVFEEITHQMNVILAAAFVQGSTACNITEIGEN